MSKDVPGPGKTFTPVRPKRSRKGVIHAFSYDSTEYTLCNIKMHRWLVTGDEVTCKRCKKRCL